MWCGLRGKSDTAVALNNLAALYQARGEWKRAEVLYRRALAMKERVLPADHPDIATTANNLAIVCRHRGRPEEASALYGRALEILQRTLGPAHPATVAVRGSPVASAPGTTPAACQATPTQGRRDATLEERPQRGHLLA